jgi:hypothetical protein
MNFLKSILSTVGGVGLFAAAVFKYGTTSAFEADLPKSKNVDAILNQLKIKRSSEIFKRSTEINMHELLLMIMHPMSPFEKQIATNPDVHNHIFVLSPQYQLQKSTIFVIPFKFMVVFTSNTYGVPMLVTDGEFDDRTLTIPIIKTKYFDYWMQRIDANIENPIFPSQRIYVVEAFVDNDPKPLNFIQIKFHKSDTKALNIFEANATYTS